MQCRQIQKRNRFIYPEFDILTGIPGDFGTQKWLRSII